MEFEHVQNISSTSQLFSVCRTSFLYHSTDCSTKLNVHMRCSDGYHIQHLILFPTFVEERLNRPQRNHSTYFDKIERMLKQMLNMFAWALNLGKTNATSFNIVEFNFVGWCWTEWPSECNMLCGAISNCGD